MKKHSGIAGRVEENPLLDEFFDLEEEQADAMRELETIERAERDLDCLKRYGEVRAGRALFFGKFFSAAILSFLALSPGTASAEERVKKPVVCVRGHEVAGEGFRGYLCTDGKRPRLLTRFTKVSFVDETGAARSYVLGWATVKPREVPASLVKL